MAAYCALCYTITINTYFETNKPSLYTIRQSSSILLLPSTFTVRGYTYTRSKKTWHRRFSRIRPTFQLNENARHNNARNFSPFLVRRQSGPKINLNEILGSRSYRVKISSSVRVLHSVPRHMSESNSMHRAKITKKKKKHELEYTKKPSWLNRIRAERKDSYAYNTTHISSTTHQIDKFNNLKTSFVFSRLIIK